MEMGTGIRLLFSDPQGGGGLIWGPGCPTHPPTSRKLSLGEKRNLLKMPEVEAGFRYANLVLALTHAPTHPYTEPLG